MLHDANDATLFPRLPEEEVIKLARYGSEVRLGAGDLLFSEEDPPRDFFVVLEGEIEMTKRIGGRKTALGVHGRGEFTGDVSLVTGRREGADARSVGESRMCRIEGKDFARVMVENPAVAGVVFRAVAGRTQELDAEMQQTARLASLGTMSAGLAHELNNPASAASRAADRLEETLRELGTLALNLGEHRLTGEQRDLLSVALSDARSARPPVDLDTLTRSDREDELAEWLEGRGVADAWDLAPAFVDAGLGEEALGRMVGRMNPEAAPDALGWLAFTLAADGAAAEVRHAVGHVSELVGAMKEYTHMDQAPLQDVDVREGLDSTLTVLGHKLRTGVEVVRDYEEGLPRLLARGSALNQVWTQLIANAADAVGGQGRIGIRVAREDDRLVVEISDDGPGIPEGIRNRVFEPFFTTKGVGEGTGLGLDVARRIVVNGHGGDIRFSSEPGDTRFQVRLPLGADGPRTGGS